MRSNESNWRSSGGDSNDKRTLEKTHFYKLPRISRLSQEIILWFIGPALGGITFFVGKKLGYDDALSLGASGVSIFCGIALTQIVSFSQQNLNIEKSLKKTSDTLLHSFDERARDVYQEISKLTKNQKNRVEIIRLPSHELFKFLRSSSETAQVIKNTYIGLTTIDNPVTEKEVVGLYNRFLSKENNKWIDLTSIEAFLSGRFEKIGCGDSKIEGAHEIILLNSHIPIVNYAIFGSDEDDLDEVYFGWVMISQSKLEIYRSTDKKLISLFNSHFQQLSNFSGRYALKVDYSLNQHSRFEDVYAYRYNGFWISISGSINSSSINSIVSFSIIRIYHADGRWKLQGYIFDRESLDYSYRIHAEKCMFVDRQFVYNYDKIKISPYKLVNGLGRMQLSRSPVDAATGFYVDDNAPKKFTTSARKIYLQEDSEILAKLFNRLLRDDPYVDLRQELDRIISGALWRIARKSSENGRQDRI